ncbi:hypothetical protein [Flavobacterium sp.]|uniref:hypothetical protein n=1 Tax=Flavobacterium sp. TaxID=239 RepID=UPI00374D5C75
MNKLKSISTFLFLFSITILTSCSVEPYEGIIPDPNANANTAGTYLMTGFNTSVPTDLNGDGNFSGNQMTETACFNNNTLVLNIDNTFTATQKGVEIDFSGATNVLACYADPNITGSWTLVNGTLTLTYMDTGVQYNDVYTVVGNTLKATINQGDVIGIVSGSPITLTANIDIIYTKQ